MKRDRKQERRSQMIWQEMTLLLCLGLLSGWLLVELIKRIAEPLS